MDKTVVIFRKFKNEREAGQVVAGEVIALFPEIPGDRGGSSCESYMHIGQHSAADPWGVIRRSRPAKPSEYAALKRELEGAPYHYNLVVKQKMNHKMHRTRRA